MLEINEDMVVGIRTFMFANRNESLSLGFASFAAIVGGILTAGAEAPLLFTPFWTGLPEALPVTGLTDDRDHAEGLLIQESIVSNYSTGTCSRYTKQDSKPRTHARLLMWRSWKTTHLFACCPSPPPAALLPLLVIFFDEIAFVALVAVLLF